VTPAPGGAGEERGEVGGGLRVGGGEAAGERQLVDVGAGLQAGERGEQRGVGEHRARQQIGGGLPGGRSA
jgi:hypothetical protein